MTESEKIRGDGITRIFEELLHRRTHLKLNLLDADFQHPTIVTALTSQKTGPSFVIDTPEGFREAAANIDPWHIHFEFTGKDNIKYSFETIGGKITDGQIKINLPEIVERKQRRKLFRINAPAGTILCFTINTTQYELEVIDISLGGSLAALVQAGSHVYPKPPFAEIGEIKDVELVFPERICQKPIKIKTAEIKRKKKNQQAPRYEMALEFTEISNRDAGLLTDLIYRIQRQYLRKRLPLDL
jgi:c-di-GMP-binding flagellar brake protein YcgR